MFFDLQTLYFITAPGCTEDIFRATVGLYKLLAMAVTFLKHDNKACLKKTVLTLTMLGTNLTYQHRLKISE